MAQKRERGLYKPPNSPNWYFDFQINGRRYQGSTGESSLTRARDVLERKRAEARDEANGIKRSSNKRVLFSALLVSYLQAKSEKKSRPSDIGKVSKFVSFFGGNTPVSSLEGNEMEFHKFIKARLLGDIFVTSRYDSKAERFVAVQQPGKAPACSRVNVNRDLALLRSIFNWGIENGLCARQPVKRTMFDRRAEEQSKRMEFLTDSEAERYLSACSPQYYPVALCALETGCRRNEILHLAWADVDLNNSVFTLKNTKAGKQRTVYITPRLAETLVKIKESRGATGHVFLSRSGDAYKDVRRGHGAALKDSGLEDERKRAGKPPLRFHDLRHTFASALAKSSRDLNVVRRALGHADIQTTMRYAHLTERQYSDSVRLMSEEKSKQACQNMGDNVRIFTIVDLQGEKVEEFNSEKTALNQAFLR